MFGASRRLQVAALKRPFCSRGRSGDAERTGDEAQVGRDRVSGGQRVPSGGPRRHAAWFVLAGSRRERPGQAPSTSSSKTSCGSRYPANGGSCAVVRTTDRSAATRSTPPLPLSRRGVDDELVWVDLDLDFEVTGDDVEIEDEAQFHDHAHTMGYPQEVVRGAWSGISTIGRGTPTATGHSTGQWKVGWQPSRHSVRASPTRTALRAVGPSGWPHWP